MKTVKIDLSPELKFAEIHTFADEHIGSAQSELQRVKDRIEYVKTNENAFCILNGDLMDNVTKTSLGDLYMQDFNPMKQLQLALELFEPIKNKILCITHGNHENRTYRNDGIDMSRIMASQLGLLDRYSPGAIVLFLTLGKMSSHDHNYPAKYTFYILHGSGGGRKEGSKAVRLADMASIIDCDIYVHAHTHLPMVLKQGFYRTSLANNSIEFVEHLFVNTAANLDYGGYGEAGEFKPNSLRSPVILVSGTKKEFTAHL